MSRCIIGIDEAGRGPLAGPVVVGAVALPKGSSLSFKGLPKLKDSKQLSKSQREVWFEYIKNNPDIFFSSARIYQKKIDRINIAQASNLAASKALEYLMREIGEPYEILIDGSLYLGDPAHKDLNAKTIIRGDEKRTAIKLASIVAKVTRDRYMDLLHERYPEYGFGSHKGYGTKFHLKMIKKHGICPIHRRTYTIK